MAYVRTDWLPKGEANAPAINATRLNNIEDGIEEALGKISFGKFSSDGYTDYQDVELGFKPSCVLGADKYGNLLFLVAGEIENNQCQIIENGVRISNTTSVDGDNINKYFLVTNDTYCFAYNPTTQSFMANNTGKNSSTATTKLQALYDLSISFDYEYITERSCDKYTFKHNDANVFSELSDVGSGSVKCDIKAGDILTFKYSKDGSAHASGEKCLFKNVELRGTGENIFYMAIK